MRTPHRIVIGADAHDELRRAIAAARPDLEIRGARSADVSAADLEWGDVYVGFRRPRTPSMGDIAWVHCTGAGVDSWLYPDELSRAILLTRTSESFGLMIAEWALARALAFSQHIVELSRAQERREWTQRYPRPIRGTNAVIVGTGDIGTHIGRLFTALGSRVSGVSRSGRADPAVFSRAASVTSLRELASEADWLILALPLTAATRGLVSRAVLEACHGAVLINAGRGAVVDESAIPDALDRGWLRGAALDVFETEPLPRSSPLWGDERVMVSPHISGPTTTAAAAAGFLECLADVERGVVPKWTVDREKQY